MWNLLKTAGSNLLNILTAVVLVVILMIVGYTFITISMLGLMVWFTYKVVAGIVAGVFK